MLSHPRFEPNGSARRDVEPVTVGSGPVELQRRVGLREVDVAAHLNGAVTVVDHVQLEPLGTFVDDDVTVAEDDFSRNHCVILTGSGGGR
jgi:hypothetical protein